MLLDARRAEIVGDAADRDHQRVVRIARTGVIGRPSSSNLAARFTIAARAVEADHLAVAKPEAVPVGLGEIVELVPGNVHAAGGDFVQQRLPQMGARLVDERDLGAVAPAELIAEASDELEPAGAAADHDDAVEVAARRGFRRQSIRRRARHGRSHLPAGPGIMA